MTKQAAERIWAEEQFGDAALGDARRTARLVRIATRVAENPSGKLSEVFGSARELDAAYDFVERDQTKLEQLEDAVGRRTARQCVVAGRVRIAVDGSSASVVDGSGKKGLGRIGADASGGHGLKVVSALAVDAKGATIGLLSQSWWARPRTPRRSSRQRQAARERKDPEQKETRYWLETIQRSASRLEEVGTLGWFQLDREADAWPTLLALVQSGHWFTVRSAWDRVLEATGRDKQYLRAKMAASPVLGSYVLDLPGHGGRSARQAHMVMHAAEVTLSLRDKRNKKRRPLPLRVIWVHEQDTPLGERPLDWMLLTNAPIDSVGAARKVVLGYTTRWRIEDFQKTWKSGACNVEVTQLRSRNAILRWATLLAVVATRIERLKHLGRTEPDRPASDELTAVEIEVLLVLKRRYKKRTESVPDAMPTMAQAVRWIADIGGYTGKSSGGPPSSTTIGRGFERLKNGVEAVLAIREAGR